MWYLVFFVICICSAFGQDSDSRFVVIPQGPVVGYKDHSRNIFTFYNIPYATALTGRDRYKAPQPPPNWTEPFEAIDRKIVCPQGPAPYIDLSDKLILEDCLIVNVFVPDTDQTNLPVMVNFHGGAFRVGYGNQEPFQTFAGLKNIIVVNFNYRLGIHGFVCLGTEDIPGNAGLKDQLALLRWVNKNIGYFGGNPEDVTISGCSAGSSSVNLMALSKASEGLFNKVISDSGAHISAFSLQLDPIENAKKHARSSNFTNADDRDALEEFYKSASVASLQMPYENQKNIVILFSPCIERDLGQERVVEEAPFNILTRGEQRKYPMLYGFTNMEGIMQLSNLDVWTAAMNQDFWEFLPGDLHFNSDEDRDEVAEKVKEFYFGDQPIGIQNVLDYVYYFTDVMFGYSMMKSSELKSVSGSSNMYLHLYSFYDENTMTLPGTDIRGASHCVQAQAVQDQDETLATQEYRNMKATMREIWHNFITTSQPVPEGSSLPAWPPVGANRSPYMSLGRTLELRTAMLEDRFRLWEEIYQKYRLTPVAPHPNSASIIVTLRILLIVSILISCIS